MLALRDATTRGSVAYDQAELVRAAALLLVDTPDLLAAERARCRHVYVDELADTDPAQIDLLGLIAGGGAHVVGLGDPDSSTFAFRGGDPTGMRDFTERFPTARGDEAPRLTLTTNYRSVPELVSATRRVAARLRGPAQHRRLQPVLAATDGPPTLDVVTLRSLSSESAYVAQRLREAHLRHGIPWSRMAVIVRSLQHHHAALRRALAQSGVPLTTGAEDTALATQPAVAPLLLLLRCALDESTLDEEAAVSLLHSPLGGADPMSERRLRQGLRQIAAKVGDARASGELLVEALTEPSVLSMLDGRWVRPARTIADLMRDRPGDRGPHGGHRRGRALAGVAGQRPVRQVGRRTAPAAGGAARPPTVTSTRCWSCSTRPPASPTGCPGPASRRSSTTCSTSSCRPTRWPRRPSAARRCAS